MARRLLTACKRQLLAVTGFNLRATAWSLGLLLLVAALTGSTTSIPAAKTESAAPHSARPSDAPQTLPRELEPPAYAPGPSPFHDGERLVYQTSWLGIPAATARIELHRNPENPSLWTAQAWVQTNRLVDLLFRMRDYVEENFHRGSFAPVSMYISQHENRRFNQYRVSFDKASGLVTMRKTNFKGSQTRRVLAAHPWGPLSGVMMALSQPLAPGGTWAFHVFTGSNHYVFDLHVLRREKIRTAAGAVDAFRIAPGVLYVSDGELNSRVRGLTVWVSADGRRLPLRAEAQVFIGRLRADLVEADGQAVAPAVMRVPPDERTAPSAGPPY